MDNNCKETYKHIERLVGAFCKIILTKKDGPNIDKAKQYIDNLTNDDKGYLNLDSPETDPQVRLIVQINITDYLNLYNNFSTPDSVEHPFEFDSAGAYTFFIQSCIEYYREKNQRAPLPSVLKFTLEHIQEMSEHYRIFSYFYDVRSKETASQIISDMVDVAEERTKVAVTNATKDSAEQAVKKEVENKIKDVSEKISEISVTILGIFAGIVLTVVAGLFYSSSVLESINSADFYKLLCISALVGLVCLHLIVAMFRFVARIGEKSEKKFFSDWVIVVITVVLIIIMTIGFVLHLKNPTPNTSTGAETSDINANVDVNISYNDTTSANITDGSETPETTSDSTTQ